MLVLEPELTCVGGALRPNMRIEVDSQGRIHAVHDLRASPPIGPARHPVTPLARRGILPGFVNVHSHAFQRGLRGRGETFPVGRGDFWSWREAMYDLVLRLDRDSMRKLCRQAFREMLAAGFTTVGEFHYVHHLAPNPTDRTPSGDFALDEIVLEAAAEAGIRIALLYSYYKTGGFDGPLQGGQRRFATFDVQEFLTQAERLSAQLDSRMQSFGIAPHSLRAVPTRDLDLLFSEATRRGWVCHVHVEEVRKEIEDCQRVLGCSPLQWMLDHLPLDRRTSIIHATHSTPADLARYLATGANICVCPITEGNLGDGLGDVASMLQRHDAVSIGTDSNVRLDACEELRWLEFVRRLRHEKRGICKSPAGDVAVQLLQCGTTNGARSLDLPIGEIKAGAWADLVAIDLDHPTLVDTPTDATLAAMLLGSSAACISDTWVGGRRIAPGP